MLNSMIDDDPPMLCLGHCDPFQRPGVPGRRGFHDVVVIDSHCASRTNINSCRPRFLAFGIEAYIVFVNETHPERTLATMSSQCILLGLGYRPFQGAALVK
jgi:hypothetical protein